MPIQHRLIKEAFRKKLLDFPGDSPVQMLLDAADLFPDEDRFAWEGENFDPPAKGIWVRETYVRNDETLAATDLYEARGTYKLDLFCPQGEGTRELEDLGDALKVYFKPASSFVDSDTSVQVAIDKSEASTAKVERSTVSVGQNYPWLNVTVTVNWRSYAAE